MLVKLPIHYMYAKINNKKEMLKSIKISDF